MTANRGGYVIEVDRLPRGENAVRFDGHQHGAGVSIFLTRNRPGTGPDLHRHPYEETFIVQDGEARFTVGGEATEAGAGQIVIAPAGVAHKFVNIGGCPLRQVKHPPLGPDGDGVAGMTENARAGFAGRRGPHG